MARRAIESSTVAGGDDTGSAGTLRSAGVNAPGYSWRVVPAENYEPQDGRAVYRFFELFDLPNIPGIENALERTQKGELPLRRRSSLISKRKCGSRSSGFSRCANSGDANLETNTSSSYRK